MTEQTPPPAIEPASIEPGTIELGDDFAMPAPAVRSDALARRRRFAVRLGVPLLAVLLFVASSTELAPSPLRVVARVPVGMDARVMLTGDSVIVVDIRDHHNTITAYALHGGARRWSQPLQLLASEVDMQTAGSAVVVSMADVDVSGPHTQAFDVATGAHLWDSSSTLRAVTDDGDVLLDANHADGVTLTRSDPVSGKPRWSADIPADCQTGVTGDPDHNLPEALIEMCPPATAHGALDPDHVLLRTLDLASGAIRVTRDIDITPYSGVTDLPSNERMPGPELDVFGDVVAVAHPNSPTPTVDAFQLGTLRELWHGLPISSTETLEGCGLELCLVSGAGSTELDPHTSRPVGPGLPFGEVSAAPTAFVLVPVGRSEQPPYALAQVRSGLGVPVPDASLGGTVWVSTLRSPAGSGAVTTTPIQSLHGISVSACVLAGGFLVCATKIDELTFWRLPA